MPSLLSSDTSCCRFYHHHHVISCCCLFHLHNLPPFLLPTCSWCSLNLVLHAATIIAVIVCHHCCHHLPSAVAATVIIMDIICCCNCNCYSVPTLSSFPLYTIVTIAVTVSCCLLLTLLSPLSSILAITQPYLLLQSSIPLPLEDPAAIIAIMFLTTLTIDAITAWPSNTAIFIVITCLHCCHTPNPAIVAATIIIGIACHHHNPCHL